MNSGSYEYEQASNRAERHNAGIRRAMRVSGIPEKDIDQILSPLDNLMKDKNVSQDFKSALGKNL